MQNIINQTLGCCRLIYNKGLAMRNEAYQNGNKIGYSQTSAMLTDLKKSDGFAFLKAVILLLYNSPCVTLKEVYKTSVKVTQGLL